MHLLPTTALLRAMTLDTLLPNNPIIITNLLLNPLQLKHLFLTPLLSYPSPITKA